MILYFCSPPQYRSALVATRMGILRLLSDNRKTLYYFISTNQKYLDEYLYLQVTKSIPCHFASILKANQG